MQNPYFLLTLDMSEQIVLNQQGREFANMNRAVYGFLQQAANKLNIAIQNKDNIQDFCCVNFLLSNVLENLLMHVHIEIPDIYTGTSWSIVMKSQGYREISDWSQLIGRVSYFCEQMNKFQEQKVIIDGEQSYFSLVQILFKAFQCYSQLEEALLKIEMVDSDITHSPDEVKLVINELGLDNVEIVNINQDLNKDPSIFGNSLWVLYIITIFAQIGYGLMANQSDWFGLSAGATASQVNYFTLTFNSVQLICCPLLHYLSDIIGRKIIYCSIIVIYAICTGCFLMLNDLKNKYQSNSIIIQTIFILRAIAGIAALTAPLSYTIISDLAPPKIRAKANVMINVSGVAATVIGSAIVYGLSAAKKYQTGDPNLSSEEVWHRSWLSFRDQMIVAVALFGVSFVLALFVLKESNAKIVGQKYLKSISKQQLSKKDKVKVSQMLLQVLRNKDLVLLFFAYILSLCCTVSYRNMIAIHLSKTYGFSNVNEAKAFSSIAQIVGLGIGAIISGITSPLIIKKFGELRAVIMCQFVAFIIGLINFIPNAPTPKWVFYITMLFLSFCLVYCDTPFLQFCSMYTDAYNKGFIMGLFQIGNSVGRMLSALFVGLMQDYNIRDTNLLITLFGAGSLLILLFPRPPIQRTQMDNVKKEHI